MDDFVQAPKEQRSNIAAAGIVTVAVRVRRTVGRIIGRTGTEPVFAKRPERTTRIGDRVRNIEDEPWAQNRIRRVVDEDAEEATAETGVVPRVHQELVPTGIDGRSWREFLVGRCDEVEILLYIVEKHMGITLRKAEL